LASGRAAGSWGSRTSTATPTPPEGDGFRFGADLGYGRRMPLSQRLPELDAFLLELNRASAAVILPLFRGDHGIENKASKGDYDPVTLADKGAEAEIRRLISLHYPDHGVIGEEMGEDRPDADFVWVLDPVDGTRAFVAGLPVWTTLIALRFEGQPVLGSIGQPFIGEVFVGQAAGSRLVTAAGERPLQVRAGQPLADAIIATTDPEACFGPAELAAWKQLRAASRLARLGCDAYAYAMVAAGAVGLVVESGLKSWDVEAAVPVIAGAGGLVTDWRGAPIGRHGGQMAIAADRALLDEALGSLEAAAR
jgi:histidinol phosphatase-like enzyme (inositol monophosphatase family)